MTTVTSTSGTGTTSSSTSSSSSSSSSTGLDANFNTFLTLLTAQLKNQDPLNPTDASQFTNQLVQYSSVEQQMKTNSLLTNLNTNMTANSGGTAVSYLGKTATTTDTTAGIVDGTATWNYNLPQSCSNVTLNIYDENGELVKSTSGETSSGDHTLSWDGTNTAGKKLTSGTYTLEVEATNSAGSSVTADITRNGTITSVDMSGSEPKVMLGGSYVTLGKLSNITLS